jgi:hypothetical protein
VLAEKREFRWNREVKSRPDKSKAICFYQDEIFLLVKPVLCHPGLDPGSSEENDFSKKYWIPGRARNDNAKKINNQK